MNVKTRNMPKKQSNMTTDKQKADVHFCEKWLNVTYDGDINNFQQVSDFLSEYLGEAKLTYEEIAREYESYLWDLMDQAMARYQDIE